MDNAATYKIGLAVIVWQLILDFSVCRALSAVAAAAAGISQRPPDT